VHRERLLPQQHAGRPGEERPWRSKQWVSGSFIYTCTGSLLNDTVTPGQIPYLLTANHCINRAQDASNLQAYFQFTLPCGITAVPAQTNPGGMAASGGDHQATGPGRISP